MEGSVLITIFLNTVLHSQTKISVGTEMWKKKLKKIF